MSHINGSGGVAINGMIFPMSKNRGLWAVLAKTQQGDQTRS
jgi:hypothetical protein